MRPKHLVIGFAFIIARGPTPLLADESRDLDPSNYRMSAVAKQDAFPTCASATYRITIQNVTSGTVLFRPGFDTVVVRDRRGVVVDPTGDGPMIELNSSGGYPLEAGRLLTYEISLGQMAGYTDADCKPGTYTAELHRSFYANRGELQAKATFTVRSR